MTVEPSGQLSDLRRRRAAALRCEPMSDGRRDPLEPEDHPLTLDELDRWAAALLHLRRQGLPGLPPPEVRCALAAHPDRYADVLPRSAA